MMAAAAREGGPLRSPSRSNAPRQETLPDAAVEDYLKAIYQHTEWQEQPITPSALATMLDVSPASVTGMVKKLAAAGLVEHQPYGPVMLSATGVSRAVAVVRRHRLVETWLVREMGYDWDQVHEEAELLEHSISDRLLALIDERLGHPERDPHGDPIPDASGDVTKPSSVRLSDTRPDDVGTVLRISDRNPDLLRLLASREIGPGTRVRVRSATEAAIGVSTEDADEVVGVARPDADDVWLTSLRTPP